MKRRHFIKNASLTGVGLTVGSSIIACAQENSKTEKTSVVANPKASLPLVIATWNVPNATSKAWETLKNGGSALDAVEKGCMVEEADVNNTSVGKVVYQIVMVT